MIRPVVAGVCLALFGLLLALGIASCADTAARVRKHTYPPDFDYITNKKVEGTMWEVAALTSRLHTLSEDPAGFSANRVEILQILEELETLVAKLKRKGVPSNHPMLNANLDLFRSDIEKARFDVQREPPSFRRAMAIPSACVYCHGGGPPEGTRP